MDQQTPDARPSLQELETAYLSIEYELLNYVLKYQPNRINEVKSWLTSLHEYSVEDRTFILRVFTSRYLDEAGQTEIEKMRAQQMKELREHQLTEHLIQTWMRYQESYEQLKKGQNE